MSCLEDYYEENYLTEKDVSKIFYFLNCHSIQDDMVDVCFEWVLNKNFGNIVSHWQKTFNPKKYPLLKNMENYAKARANIQFTNFLNSKCDESVITENFKDIYEDVMEKELFEYIIAAYLGHGTRKWFF